MKSDKAIFVVKETHTDPEQEERIEKAEQQERRRSIEGVAQKKKSSDSSGQSSNGGGGRKQSIDFGASTKRRSIGSGESDVQDSDHAVKLIGYRKSIDQGDRAAIESIKETMVDDKPKPIVPEITVTTERSEVHIDFYCTGPNDQNRTAPSIITTTDFADDHFPADQPLKSASLLQRLQKRVSISLSRPGNGLPSKSSINGGKRQSFMTVDRDDPNGYMERMFERQEIQRRGSSAFELVGAGIMI